MGIGLYQCKNNLVPSFQNKILKDLQDIEIHCSLNKKQEKGMLK